MMLSFLLVAAICAAGFLCLRIAMILVVEFICFVGSSRTVALRADDANSRPDEPDPVGRSASGNDVDRLRHH